MTAAEAIPRFFYFRSHGAHDNLPWLTKAVTDGQPATRLALATLMGTLGYTEGVEVGTCHGHYALALCDRIPGLHLTCVDPWTAYQSVPQRRLDRAFRHARLRLNSRDVTFRRAPSLEVAATWPDRSLDFVYIDGDHTFDAVVRDIVSWAGKVKVGGIVALHDYCAAYQSGVVMAVDAYTRAHHIDPWFITREQTPSVFWVNV